MSALEPHDDWKPESRVLAMLSWSGGARLTAVGGGGGGAASRHTFDRNLLRIGALFRRSSEHVGWPGSLSESAATSECDDAALLSPVLFA